MLAENKTNPEKHDIMLEETNSLGGITAIQRKSRKSLWIALGCILGIVALFLLGFLVGYFARRPESKPCSLETENGEQSNDFEEYHAMFKDSISAEKLESVMR